MTNTIGIARDFVSSLTGLPAWGFKSGFSTFTTMEFGNVDELLSSENKTIHGKWHLWVEMAAWRFLRHGRLIIASDDEETRKIKMIESIAQIKPVTVSLAEVGKDVPDLAITFSDGMRFEATITSSGPEDRQWTLYTPDRMALTIYGDGHHSIGP